jgi:hypothetical protein
MHQLLARHSFEYCSSFLEASLLYILCTISDFACVFYVEIPRLFFTFQ